MNKTNILSVFFSSELHFNEIPKFRSTVLRILGNDTEILFHNHVGESLRYSYPLIQYKTIGKKAAIVCIKEGTEAIGNLFSKCSNEDFQVSSIKADKYLIQLWDSDFSYHLRKWMPLSQENYHAYSLLEGIAEKAAFLENILFGNLLSFTKGIGVTLDKQMLRVKIIDIGPSTIIPYKGVKMMNFDVEFKTNLSIPNYVGIGKGASLGHGVIRKNNQNNQ